MNTAVLIEAPELVTAGVDLTCGECGGDGYIHVATCYHSGYCPCDTYVRECEDCIEGVVVCAFCDDAEAVGLLDSHDGDPICRACFEAELNPAPEPAPGPMARHCESCDEPFIAPYFESLGRHALRCTPCTEAETARLEAARAAYIEERKRQEEEWAERGLRRPYGYDMPPELGGKCWDCEADWGGHRSYCQAVN